MYHLMLSKSTKCVTTPAQVLVLPLASPVGLNLSLSLSGFNVVNSKIGGLNLFLWMLTLIGIN